MAEETPELRLTLPRTIQPFTLRLSIEPNTGEVPIRRSSITGESSSVPAKESQEDRIKEKEGGKKKEGGRHKASKENFGGERCQGKEKEIPARQPNLPGGLKEKKPGMVDKIKEQPKLPGDAKEKKPGMVDKIKEKPRHQNHGGAKEKKPGMVDKIKEKPRHQNQNDVDKRK